MYLNGGVAARTKIVYVCSTRYSRIASLQDFIVSHFCWIISFFLSHCARLQLWKEVTYATDALLQLIRGRQSLLFFESLTIEYGIDLIMFLANANTRKELHCNDGNFAIESASLSIQIAHLSGSIDKRNYCQWQIIDCSELVKANKW